MIEEDIHDFCLEFFLEEGFALSFGGFGEFEDGTRVEYLFVVGEVVGDFCVFYELLHLLCTHL